MTANTNPIFGLVPNIGHVAVTAANTKSDGTGTGVGTDIFKCLTAGTNGTWVSKVRFNFGATVAGTSITATVARVYYSTVGSGATVGGTDTFLIGEVSIPGQTADSSSQPVTPVEVPVNFAIPTGSFIHVSTHAAPASNTSVQAIAVASDY